VRAIVIDHPGAIALNDVPDPSPAAGEVVVRVRACGVCGTDLHIAAGEFPPTPYPIIPGHEFAGEIVARGAGVPPELADGTLVAVDPSLYCGACAACRSGRGNLCARWGAIGDTVNGAFAEFVAVPAVNAYPLAPHLDARQGALAEPIACAAHALHRLGPVMQCSAVIFGAGTMGLLLLQMLLDSGASSVTVVDRVQHRLAVAKELGAQHTATDGAELAGDRFEVSVDATGAPSAIEQAFDAVARGGRLLVFGVTAQAAQVRLSPFRVYNDELTIIGSMAIMNSFQPAVNMLTSGVINAAPLLGETVPLDRFDDALARVRDGRGIKIQVCP
jgi:2-desacetyl-2-hydroxyethyl bacteriochlorophyllide A dehydrogenase